MTNSMTPEDFFREHHGGIDTTERFYPLPYMPSYQTGDYRAWRLSLMDVPMVRGYFKGLQMTAYPNIVLQKSKHKQYSTRMSLTPVELESHMPHIAAARGHVLVIGLGMGLYLYNILRKPEVTAVTIIEKDKSVVKFLEKRAGLRSWPAYRKVTAIYTMDAFSHGIPDCVYDHTYTDIWEQLGSEQAREDVVRLASRYQSGGHSWWGMELDFVEWCTTNLEEDQRLEEGMMREFAEGWADAAIEHGINLRPIVYQENWPEYALKAVQNVTLY